MNSGKDEDFIREYRKSLGMTQEEFSKRFEIPLSTLRSWEQKRAATPRYLIKLFKEWHELKYGAPPFTKIEPEDIFYSPKNVLRYVCQLMNEMDERKETSNIYSELIDKRGNDDENK